jgi:23S rRNA pseudouridine2605 synthase
VSDEASSGFEGDGERLQKVLARAGIGSRRTCDELIAEGRVLVNGAVARLGQRVDVAKDTVLIDGAPVGIMPGLVYYLLNKPEGVITTASDPEGRPTVLDLVPPTPRVFSVGRLDAATSGLLVMTNDGELAQVVSHPSHGVEKEYLAEVEGDPSPGALRRLREGVEIEPGVITQPARVARRGPGVLRIVIHEGRNRQVRRMCDVVGHPVRRLVRTRIGPIADAHLEPGQYRQLTQREVRDLSLAAASGRQVKPGN